MIKLGPRIFHLRYLIWLERDEGAGGVEAAFEEGRVFRFEGDDAERLWKKVSQRVDPKGSLLTVAYGKPVSPKH